MEKHLPETPAPQPEPSRKFGQGAAQAALRLGMKEFGQLLKAFPDSIPIFEEPGQLGTATPQEVAGQMGYVSPMMAQKQAEIQTPAMDMSKQREMEM